MKHKRRHPMRIISEILHFCGTPQIMANITKSCNLAYDDARPYISNLINLKMITANIDPDYRGNRVSSTIYVITDYGIQCRNKLRELLKLFNM